MKGPRVPRTEPKKILDLKQVGKLLRTAHDSEWFPLIYLSLVTSMRQGELFGLTWGAVNLQEGYIRVTKALSQPRTVTPYWSLRQRLRDGA